MFKNVTIGRTARIVQSYSPDGANLHPHLVDGSLGSLEFHLERHSDRFIRFCRVRRSAQRTQTTQRVTSAAIGRVSAMNAMRPLITPRPTEPPQSNLVIHFNVSK